MGARQPGARDRAPSVARTLRWTVPLAVVAIGLLIAVTFRARPAPGLHGEHLAVSATLGCFAAALLGFERVPAEAPWARQIRSGSRPIME